MHVAYKKLINISSFNPYIGLHSVNDVCLPQQCVLSGPTSGFSILVIHNISVNMKFIRGLGSLAIYSSLIPDPLFSQHWHLDPMSAGSFDGFLVTGVGMAHNS